MKNKEDGNYRPTYYCIRDNKTDLLWVIPMSSQYNKYKNIVEKKIEKYKKCNTIVLGEFDGKKSVFLLQNMFPITEKYLDHIHTRNNNPVPVKYKTKKIIENYTKDLLNLTRKGYKIVFPDILRLEKIMLQEIKSEYKYTRISKKEFDKINHKFNFDYNVVQEPSTNECIIRVKLSDYEKLQLTLQNAIEQKYIK